MLAVKETDILLMESMPYQVIREGRRVAQKLWFFMEDTGNGLKPLTNKDGSQTPLFTTYDRAVNWIMKTAGDDVESGS